MRVDAKSVLRVGAFSGRCWTPDAWLISLSASAIYLTNGTATNIAATATIDAALIRIYWVHFSFDEEPDIAVFFICLHLSSMLSKILWPPVTLPFRELNQNPSTEILLELRPGVKGSGAICLKRWIENHRMESRCRAVCCSLRGFQMGLPLFCYFCSSPCRGQRPRQ